MMTRSEFLLDCIKVALQNLSKPNIRYPNGRMSHDVENEHLMRCKSEYYDYAIEHGLWGINGFFGFREDGRDVKVNPNDHALAIS